LSITVFFVQHSSAVLNVTFKKTSVPHTSAEYFIHRMVSVATSFLHLNQSNRNLPFFAQFFWCFFGIPFQLV